MTSLLDRSPERQRRGRGPRRARLREQRRAERAAALRRVAGVVGLLAAVVAGVAVLAAALLWWRGSASAPGPDATTDPAVEAVAAGQTLLLIRTDTPGGPAASITLLVAGPADHAAAVFVPTNTLMEVPGAGLDRLALAAQYGGTQLVAQTLGNTLGVVIDHHATVTTDDLGAVLQRSGGLVVDVGEQLVRRHDDGTAEVAFDAGEQYLNGARLAEYWAFEERGETELDSFVRVRAVLEAWFSALEDPDVLAAQTERGLPQVTSDLDEEGWRELLGLMAAGTPTFHVLPVEPFGTDATFGQAYRLVDQELPDLLDAALPGAAVEGPGEAVRVQVLNGVGRPGVGSEVETVLAGHGFRIVLSENARSFDFAETRILIYDESEASVAAAREVRELMGVGTILVSRQPQSVVDLTVVVGRDFTAGDGR